MATHVSASVREEAPHAIKPVDDELRQRAESIINNRSVDPRSRIIIQYGLETNDPWLAGLVMSVERGIEAKEFSQTPEPNDVVLVNEKIEALAEIICQARDESAAALLVLMGMFDNSPQPRVLANSVKHYAFTRCGELNLFGMVDAQIAVVEGELFAEGDV